MVHYFNFGVTVILSLFSSFSWCTDPQCLTEYELKQLCTSSPRPDSQSFWSESTRSCIRYYKGSDGGLWNLASLSLCGSSALPGTCGRLAVILTEAVFNIIKDNNLQGWIGVYVKNDVRRTSGVSGFKSEWEWKDGSEFVSEVQYDWSGGQLDLNNPTNKCGYIGPHGKLIQQKCSAKLPARICEHIPVCFISTTAIVTTVPETITSVITTIESHDITTEESSETQPLSTTTTVTPTTIIKSNSIMSSPAPTSTKPIRTTTMRTRTATTVTTVVPRQTTKSVSTKLITSAMSSSAPGSLKRTRTRTRTTITTTKTTVTKITTTKTTITRVVPTETTKSVSTKHIISTMLSLVQTSLKPTRTTTTITTTTTTTTKTTATKIATPTTTITSVVPRKTTKSVSRELIISTVASPAPTSLKPKGTTITITTETTTATTTTTKYPMTSSNWEKGLTPKYPMTKVQQVVSIAFQSLGCAFLLGSLGVTMAAFLLLRDFSHERFLHMNQEIALLFAHLLVVSLRDITHIPVLCKIVSVSMQFTFMTVFTFMTLEALQTYTIMTGVISEGGYLSRLNFSIIGWGGPAAIAAVSSVFKYNNYTSYWSCWLNLDDMIVVLATMLPVCALSAATLIMTEAASMGEWEDKPKGNQDQEAAAVVNQKGMLFILPLNVASWLCGSIAVHYANLAMFSLVSALNISLGVAIFTFHSLGNPKVHSMFKKFLSKCWKM